MRLHTKKAHPGAWLVLSVLAFQNIHTIPLRYKFFIRLHSPAFTSAVEAYILLIPFIAAIAYVLLAEGAWNMATSQRWPRPCWKGWLLLAVAYSCVETVDYSLFYKLFPGSRPPAPMMLDIVYTFSIGLGIGYIAALIDGLEIRSRETVRIAHESRWAAMEADARLVEAQINPHVIFNALGVVEAYLKDPRVDAILDPLEAYLRGVLAATKQKVIPLEQEIKIIRDFLTVHQLLLEDRLQVEWAWDDSTDQVAVPPLIMQTLVENALKHGITPSRHGGQLQVRSAVMPHRIQLSVSNTGAAPTESKGEGTGIENLRNRLSYAYGNEAEFTFGRSGDWTHADIFIPRRVHASVGG